MLLSELDTQTSEPITSGKLSDDQMKMAYDKLIQRELTKEEISDLSQQFADQGDYARTKNSAIFLLSRMHILLHGIAPEGETKERANTMFKISDHMKKFVINQGDLDLEDINYHIGEAAKELQTRKVRTKLNQEDATRIMVDFYQKHKANISNEVRHYLKRQDIIKDIMNGKTPEEAFQQYMQ